MIVAVAVVAQPPALLPGLTGGVITEVETLRAAAANAIAWATAQQPDLVVALADAATTEIWPAATPIDRAGYLGEPTTGPTLPLGLSVIRGLGPATDAIRLQSVATDLDPAEIGGLADAIANAAPQVVLLVAADGSARRGLKAPGYVDPRALPFDAELERCLSEGDAAGLERLDPGLAAELLARGTTSLRLLGAAVRGQAIAATLDYAADPFGVYYAVARWQVSAPAHR